MSGSGKEAHLLDLGDAFVVAARIHSNIFQILSFGPGHLIRGQHRWHMSSLPTPPTPNTIKAKQVPLTPLRLFDRLLLDKIVFHLLILRISHVPTPLQALHLPRLQLFQILLAQMYSSHLVAHNIRRDVLLRPLDARPCPLQRLLHYALVCLLHAPHAEIHPRPHLLDLDPRQLLSTPLRLDQVDAQVHPGLQLLPIHAISGRDGHHILQPLNIHLVRRLASEEIGEEALHQRVLATDRPLERRAGEQQHRLQAHGALLVLETLQAAPALGVQAELQHVQHLVVEGADEGEAVRTLLAAAAEDEQRGVVLLGEELERGGRLERVDGVLLGELLGERHAQLVQVGEGVLDDLRAGCAAQEEGRLGVLDGFGGFLVEGAFGARVAGFSGGWVRS